MAEQTLNQQLSGREVVEALLDKLRDKLQRDCYLNPNSAYDWFTARIKIELDLHDAGAFVKVDTAIEQTAGLEPTADIVSVDAELDIGAAPPNEVRVATGQPVPTLTTDENGHKVVKGVQYSRKGARAGRAAATSV